MKAMMLGKSLDTNGQKQRFVEAARRWGEDPDVLKALIVGKWDGAGIPARLAEAAEKGEGLSIRSAHRATAYFDFPTDIIWGRHTHRQVTELAEQADVIHLTNDVRAYTELRLHKYAKPAVLHHHGTLFRSLHDDGMSRDRLLSEAKRFHMVQAVSTMDLLRYAPNLHWLPAPIDVEAMMRHLAHHDAETVRIMSAPTRRDLKSTHKLIAAVETLKAEGLPVELVLVESRSWAECLAVKGTADIYFDQVATGDYPGGYGCNAIEAWAMGIPVVAGADEWTTDRMLQEFGALPYYAATEHSIADALRHLAKSKAERTKWGKRGKAHVLKYHDEKPALLRLVELYRLAIEKRLAAGEEVVADYALAPGRFHSPHYPKATVPLASRTIRFVDGWAEIADPEIAQRLRRRLAFTNRQGIVEVMDGEAC